MALPTLEDTFVLTLSFLSKREKPTRLSSLEKHIIEVKKLTTTEAELKYKNKPVVKRLAEIAFDHLICTPFIKGEKYRFEITTKGQRFLNNNSQFIDSQLLASQSISYSNFLKNSKNQDFFQLGDSLNSFIEKENRNRAADLSKALQEAKKKLAIALALKIDEKPKKKDLNKERVNESETLNEQLSFFPIKDPGTTSFCSQNEEFIEEKLLRFLAKEHATEVFEKVALLVAFKLVYGPDASEEKFKTSCKLTKKSGDGGVDGIITKENKKYVFVQAKRNAPKNIIREPQIRDFRGASNGQKVVGGYFITTSDFNKDAVKSAEDSNTDINLINGKRLVEYMIQFRIGIKEVLIDSKLVSGTIYEIDESYLRNIPITFQL